MHNNTNNIVALIEAARAVVDRWDSPNWGGRNLEHTADYINRLREALAAFEQPTGTVSFHPESDIGRARIKSGLPLTVPLEQNSIDERMLAKAIATYDPCFRTSIGEQPAVREMSVDEVAKIMEDETWCCQCSKDIVCAAKALAKLGTIRVVEG